MPFKHAAEPMDARRIAVAVRQKGKHGVEHLRRNARRCIIIEIARFGLIVHIVEPPGVQGFQKYLTRLPSVR
jgi:hypothetical protein